jgi:hypothetical protein
METGRRVRHARRLRYRTYAGLQQADAALSDALRGLMALTLLRISPVLLEHCGALKWAHEEAQLCVSQRLTCSGEGPMPGDTPLLLPDAFAAATGVCERQECARDCPAIRAPPPPPSWVAHAPLLSVPGAVQAFARWRFPPRAAGAAPSATAPPGCFAACSMAQRHAPPTCGCRTVPGAASLRRWCCLTSHAPPTWRAFWGSSAASCTWRSQTALCQTQPRIARGARCANATTSHASWWQAMTSSACQQQACGTRWLPASR